MNRPIIISGANTFEISYLVDYLDLKLVEYNGVEFYEGKYNNYDIVVCKSKEGEINSSISTSVSIMKYNPILLINIGTAGGYGEDVNTGDLVFGTSFRYLSQFSVMGNDDESITPWKSDCFYSTDNERIEYSINKDLEKYLRDNFYGDNIHYGVICSGDIWTKDRRIIKEHILKYDGLCEEMEVAGVYMTANLMNTLCFSVRVVSNNVLKNEMFDRGTGLIAQRYVITVLDKIIKDINKMEDLDVRIKENKKSI